MSYASYAKMIRFRNNVPVDALEYKNSWGGAAVIWDVLYNKYLKDPNKECDSWFLTVSKGDNRLWELWYSDNPAITRCERLTLLLTLDHAYVTKDNFASMASDLREFVKLHGLDKKVGVQHLSHWANDLEKCDADAIAFWMTSTVDNPWSRWNQETQESEPVILGSSDKHFDIHEVYDEYVASKTEFEESEEATASAADAPE